MRQSNTYIIVFTAILTIILGGLLSLANQGLKPMQDRSVEIDTKKQILGAVVDIENMSNEEILKRYDASIQSIVVDINGDLIEKTEKGDLLIAEDVDIAKNFKRPQNERQYPVFIFHEEGNENNVEAYIFPMFGRGLWGPIWGYVALQTDFNTIKGAKFDHESETPGLGARITENAVQKRYVGRKIFDPEGTLVSVSMLKGESNPENMLDDHNIQGLSGATITARGLTDMISNYLNLYSGFIEKVKSGEEVASR